MHQSNSLDDIITGIELINSILVDNTDGLKFQAIESVQNDLLHICQTLNISVKNLQHIKPSCYTCKQKNICQIYQNSIKITTKIQAIHPDYCSEYQLDKFIAKKDAFRL